jgi:hypothetical protein
MERFARLPQLILETLVVIAVVAACGDVADRPLIGPEVSLAKGGPSGGAPKVTAADPPSGAQGQRLNVRVLGSGFNSTAVASLERGGVVDTKITVHSTTFVSSSEVVADITIAADADIDLYDVAVEIETADGRKKGIGIEKFEVQQGPRPPNSVASASGAIVSDGLQSVYGTEGDSSLAINLGGNGQQAYEFRQAFNFSITYNTYKDAVRLGQGPCAYDPLDKAGTTDDDRRARLFALLADQSLRGYKGWGVNVNKYALGAASVDHNWAMHRETTDSLVSYALRDRPKMLPGYVPTVTEIAPHTYRFTGGALQVFDRSGQVKNFMMIVCPNLDEATVTWYPPTS